jgi:hypothetical protein
MDTSTAEHAGPASFDTLRMGAHGEPFDSPLILSLSKDERSLRTGLSNHERAAISAFIP